MIAQQQAAVAAASAAAAAAEQPSTSAAGAAVAAAAAAAAPDDACFKTPTIPIRKRRTNAHAEEAARLELAMSLEKKNRRAHKYPLLSPFRRARRLNALLNPTLPDLAVVSGLLLMRIVSHDFTNTVRIAYSLFS